MFSDLYIIQNKKIIEQIKIKSDLSNLVEIQKIYGIDKFVIKDSYMKYATHIMSQNSQLKIEQEKEEKNE